MIFIPGKMKYGIAHHDIGECVRKRHPLNEPDLKILCRKFGSQGRRELTNILDSIAVRVQGKYLAALSQQMD
jgi:hypothetical protein